MNYHCGLTPTPLYFRTGSIPPNSLIFSDGGSICVGDGVTVFNSVKKCHLLRFDTQWCLHQGPDWHNIQSGFITENLNWKKQKCKYTRSPRFSGNGHMHISKQKANSSSPLDFLWHDVPKRWVKTSPDQVQGQTFFQIQNLFLINFLPWILGIYENSLFDLPPFPPFFFIQENCSIPINRMFCVWL